MVAMEIKRIIEIKGHQVNVHHINESKPKELPPADLYIFGSPTRFGKPIGSMRRFANKVDLRPGTKYALFATHLDASPNKKTGQMPTEEAVNRERMTISVLDEIFKEKGLDKIADKVFLITAGSLKGPLKESWQGTAEEFANAILASS
jgi:hypothetical protein